MKILFVVIVGALIFGTFFFAFAFPNHEATETWKFPPVGRKIFLNVSVGSLNILPGNSSSIYVVVVQSGNGFLASFARLKFSASFANGTLDITESISPRNLWPSQVQILVYLPLGGFVAINVLKQTGNVYVHYTSLDDLFVKVRTGDVGVYLPSGREITVEVNAGSVYLALASSGAVNISTGTGAVTFRAHTLGCAPVTINTITGRIIFNTSAMQSFRLNASTVNGQIVLGGGRTDYSTVYQAPNSVSISSGSGCADVEIGSVDGSIYVQA